MQNKGRQRENVVQAVILSLPVRKDERLGSKGGRMEARVGKRGKRLRIRIRFSLIFRFPIIFHAASKEGQAMLAPSSAFRWTC